MKKSKYNVQKFFSRRGKHEFPKGKKGVLKCGICGNIYYEKAWCRDLKNHKHEHIIKKLPFIMTTCPADKMIKNNLFEGKITIENIPQKLVAELTNLIKAFGEKAYQRDCQHRIIKIKELSKNSIAVTTTENQMTKQLAKKINNTFNKKGALKISYSPMPSDTVYIKLVFRDEK